MTKAFSADIDPEMLKINPSTRDTEFLRIRVDTLVGMAVSNIIGIAIIRP